MFSIGVSSRSINAGVFSGLPSYRKFGRRWSSRSAIQCLPPLVIKRPVMLSEAKHLCFWYGRPFCANERLLRSAQNDIYERNSIKSSRRVNCGFRDFLPEDCARRNYIFARWREVARRYGFVEWEGPPLEATDLYKKKSGAEIVEQLFNFTDKGEREVALRPELTPTLARVAGGARTRIQETTSSGGSRSDNFSDTRSNSAAGYASIFSSIATSLARRISLPTSNWSRFALISCVRWDLAKKISWSGSATANSGRSFSATRTCPLSGGTIYCKRSINWRASRVRRQQRNSGTLPIPSSRRWKAAAKAQSWEQLVGWTAGSRSRRFHGNRRKNRSWACLLHRNRV